MPARPMLVEVLKRDRAIAAFGLAGVVTLSWTYLIYMDWGMRRMDVGMEMVIMPAMQHWTAWDLVLVFLMWAVMMVAMMVPAASPVILLFAEINRRRNEPQGNVGSDRTVSVGLSRRRGPPLACFATLVAVGPAYGGFGFTNDGEHEQSLGRRTAAHRRSLSVQPSEICLSGSLPISNGVFRYGMATWLMGRLQDGIEARRLLSRLLLGIDGSPFCLWRDEPVMGRQYPAPLSCWRRSAQRTNWSAALAVSCS